ncbi:hypothetical protein GBA52_015345 [Prunus armeniaca]|nr:hypothetical protein GBA52_015345 [Prunus armeniaca]
MAVFLVHRPDGGDSLLALGDWEGYVLRELWFNKLNKKGNFEGYGESVPVDRAEECHADGAGESPLREWATSDWNRGSWEALEEKGPLTPVAG